MKFSASIKINASKEKVAKLFADPQFLGEYQTGFKSKTLLEGKSGENRAVSKMIYDYRGSDMELIETILDNKLPDSFFASYHHKHMDNTMKVEFIELGNDKTLYKGEYEYTAFRGFFPNVMRILFPGMFKKQALPWLENFKNFVENYTA